MRVLEGGRRVWEIGLLPVPLLTNQSHACAHQPWELAQILAWQIFDLPLQRGEFASLTKTRFKDESPILGTKVGFWELEKSFAERSFRLDFEPSPRATTQDSRTDCLTVAIAISTIAKVHK